MICFVDLPRIELGSWQCECHVLPLNHRPMRNCLQIVLPTRIELVSPAPEAGALSVKLRELSRELYQLQDGNIQIQLVNFF